MATRVRWAWVVLGALAVGLSLVAGCQQGTTTREPTAEAESAVTLALRFVPGSTSTYKLTTEAEKSVAWEGNTAKRPAQFKDGRTGYRIEMTFEQRIERVTDEGHAMAAITIEALTYVGRSQDRVVVDFDSTRDSDQANPLAKLIGLGYQIELTPKGEVLAVIDAAPAREALEGNRPGHGTAAKLLSEKTIRRRHEIPALMASPAGPVRPNAQWSRLRSFSFGMMGAKAYERVYTFKGIEYSGDDSMADVTMEAIPPEVTPGQVSPNVSPLSKMFDSTDDYTGQLHLDLAAGRVEDYTEQYRTQWVTADPASLQSGEGDPAVLRMGAVELHRLERID